jgi:Leucine-rich repeat (LRR) protein
LPVEIYNLNNLKDLYLYNNKLRSLSKGILKIKNIITIDETSYDINNLDNDNEILIFSNLNQEITNLPINTKEIWVNKDVINVNIKMPFGSVIIFF